MPWPPLPPVEIELKPECPPSGQLAELAQQLIARHDTWIAVAATDVKAERCHAADRGR
jgi:hypothetical protein